MRKLRAPLLLLFIAVLAACGKGSVKPRLPHSQNGGAGAGAAPLRRDLKLPLAVPIGEQLVYEVRVARFPLYVAVGDVTFEYLGETGEPKIEGLNAELKPNAGERFLHFRATAVSKGFIVKTLLGLDVKDRFEALVNAGDFSTRAGVKEISEGKKHFLQVALFDRTAMMATYRTTDLTKPAQPAAEKTLNIAPDAQDLLSAFYFVRLQKLKEGDVLRFPLVYDAAQHDFDLTVLKREKVEIGLGKFKTLRLEPKLFGKGRLIQREGEMIMWVTDDERHTPVKLIAKTSGATVTATLTGVVNAGPKIKGEAKAEK